MAHITEFVRLIDLDIYWADVRSFTHPNGYRNIGTIN
jgi:hypothetical protein